MSNEKVCVLMPRENRWYPHVQQQITRHGRKVWYFRDGHGARTRLPDEYGSPEFMAAYKALLTGQMVAPACNARKVSPKSLKGLVDAFKASSVWSGLADGTRHMYECHFQAMIDKFGSELAGTVFTKANILESMEARTPASANVMLAGVRKLIEWAISAGLWDGDNPTATIKYRPRVKPGADEEEGHQTWTEEEIAKFERAYPLGTHERLLFSVLLYTGLRISDACRLGECHRGRDGLYSIKTVKTSTWVHLELLPPLKAAIAAGPHGVEGETTFVVGRRGRAFETAGAAGSFLANAAKAIGLEERSAHGLRKAAARRMAEHGASLQDLMDVFGWTNPKIAMHYIHERDKKLAAKRSQRGMLRAGTNVVELVAAAG